MGGRQPIDDSEQFANGLLGLMRAKELYDPARINPNTGEPFEFTTYASGWIQSKIGRANQRRVVTGAGRKTVTFSTIDAGSRFGGGGKEKSFGATVADIGLRPDEQAERADESREDRELCEDLLRQLSARNRQIVELKIMQGLTLEEVGEVVGVTRERVRQLLAKALAKINEYVDRRPEC